MRFSLTFAVGLLCCTGVAAASVSPWQLTAASSVHATRTRSGLTVTASVDLANPCYEAAIRRSRHTAVAEYLVVTRVKDADIGKICAMVIVPTVASGSFVVPHVPLRIVVIARNRRFVVQVGP